MGRVSGSDPRERHDRRLRLPVSAGLTVLHELLVALPHEDFVYLGDTARFRLRLGARCEQLERFSLEVATSSWRAR